MQLRVDAIKEEIAELQQQLQDMIPPEPTIADMAPKWREKSD